MQATRTEMNHCVQQQLTETAELYKSNYHLLPPSDQYSQSVYLATLINTQYPNAPKRTLERQGINGNTQNPQSINSSIGQPPSMLRTNIDTTSLETQIATTRHHAPSTDAIMAKNAEPITQTNSTTLIDTTRPNTNTTQFSSIGTNSTLPPHSMTNSSNNNNIAQSAFIDTSMEMIDGDDLILPKYRLNRIIKAHDNWVTSINIDIANKLFATGSNDQTIKIWDLQTGAQLYTFTGHLLPVNCVRFSPNFPRLFSCSSDREVKMWDLETNQFIVNLHGHKKAVTTLELHPTLDLIISGSSDRTLRMWDVRTRTCVRVLEGHREAVTTIAGLPVDPQVVSGSLDASIRLWDIGTGKAMSTHTYHQKSIRKLLPHSQQYTLLSASSDSIKQWRLPIVSGIPHDNIQQWEQTQNILYQQTPSLSIRPINPITGKQAPPKPLQEDSTTSSLTLMKQYQGGAKTKHGNHALVHSISINQNNTVIAGRSDGIIDCYNYINGKCYDSIVTPPVPGSLDSEAAICDVAFDMTGTAFLTACADKTIKMYVSQ